MRTPEGRPTLTSPTDPPQSGSLLTVDRPDLAFLNLVARYATADFGLSETQAAILNTACQELGFEAVALALRPFGDQSQLRWQSAGRMAAWEAVGGRDGLDELARQVLADGELVKRGGLSGERAKPSSAGSPKATFLCAPLVAGDEALGAVLVCSSHDFDTSGPDEALISALAGWLADGLAHAHQIRQLQAAYQALERRGLELLRSRNILRALFDSAPTLMYIIDADYTLLAVNRRRAGQAGETPQRLVSRHCFAALFQRSDPCPGCQVGETFAMGCNTRRIEQRGLPDGGALEFEISSFPIYNETGKTTQAILFEEDVTEKRRLEASLARAEKLAAVGQLAAGVAHEINNPLTAVIANAQLLERVLDDPELKDMAALIQQAGERASGVVRELLDLSRQESIDLAPVDINETLRSALALAQTRLSAGDVRLKFTPQAGLPPVLANADRLQGVWLNLLINALDAIHGEGGEIRIFAWQEGTQVLVTISDNGQGIQPEHLERVFEPFFTTKGPDQGTGLGLSISHRAIRQIGGDIRAESQPGVGTTITVSLPVA